MQSNRSATVQDIANALGLSRNTVSKALNGQSGITESTRKRVLEQAHLMNYKSMGNPAMAEPAAAKRDILLICSDWQLSSNDFFSVLIQSLIAEIRSQNATPIAQFISAKDVGNERVTQAAKNAVGIIAMESLTAPYINQLLDTGKPVVFFDYNHLYDLDDRPCDIVLSDPRPLRHIIRRMYEKGARTFGFVGNPDHCLGFQSRYETFLTATHALGAVTGPQYNVLSVGSKADFTGKEIADAYICANDYTALNLPAALAALGKRVPEDVQISGFDDIHEASTLHPALTTVHVDADTLASSLALLLFDRIEHPQRPIRILTPNAQAVFRGSTR